MAGGGSRFPVHCIHSMGGANHEGNFLSRESARPRATFSTVRKVDLRPELAHPWGLEHGSQSRPEVDFANRAPWRDASSRTNHYLLAAHQKLITSGHPRKALSNLVAPVRRTARRQRVIFAVPKSKAPSLKAGSEAL